MNYLGATMKSKNKIEIADIFYQNKSLLKKLKLSKNQWKVVQALINCRTSALGGHSLECNNCSNVEQSYNSCRNRHCPKCQFSAKVKWLEARTSELLPVNYFHLVFTLPSELNALILQNKRLCYSILFKAASSTIKEVAKNPKNLGAKVGFFMILHTWGQNLKDHPHVHVVTPAGGLALNHKSWISCKKKYFLPVKVLSSVFRGKYLSLLEKAYTKDKLVFLGKLLPFANKNKFKGLLVSSCRKRWVVYSKEPFSGPKRAIKYLSSYTHRIAISNYRIIKIENDKVHFYYKDYADNNNQKILKLDVLEFMRRFLLHVLPSGFMKIRHYGIFGNKYKSINIELSRKFLTKSKGPNREKVLKKNRNKNVNDKESTYEIIKRLYKFDITLCKKCNKGKMNPISEIKSFYSSA